MTADLQGLTDLERGIDTEHPEASSVPVSVVGYGEITTALTTPAYPEFVLKRMPLFSSREAASRYQLQFHEYSGLLREAGVRVPEQETHIVALSDRPVTLYLVQPLLPPDRFAHRIVQRSDAAEARDIISRVVDQITLVHEWNSRFGAERELSIDGQLSNWVIGDDGILLYVDTSTPLYRLQGEEQLDPELFLKSAPPVIRGIIRVAFLEEVLTRYYDLRQVFRDLAGNLYKEGRQDLIPLALDIVNGVLAGLDNAELKPLTAKETDRYYREDRLIWSIYLGARRLDRWIRTRILRRPYFQILPGPIER